MVSFYFFSVDCTIVWIYAFLQVQPKHISLVRTAASPSRSLSLSLSPYAKLLFFSRFPGFPLHPAGILPAKVEFSPSARAAAMSCVWLSSCLRLFGHEFETSPRHLATGIQSVPPPTPPPFSHATVSPHYIRKLAACWFLLVSVGQSNCDFFADTFDGFMWDVPCVAATCALALDSAYIPICGTMTTRRRVASSKWQVNAAPSYKRNLNKLIELSRVKRGQGKLVTQLN